MLIFLNLKTKDSEAEKKACEKLINKRYKCVKKLGEGVEAFIFLVKDTVEKENKYKM